MLQERRFLTHSWSPEETKLTGRKIAQLIASENGFGVTFEKFRRKGKQ